MRREVTLGEILASILIFLIMIICGIIISNTILSKIEKSNERYETAFQIAADETDLFKYSLRTNLGEAFVYGEFEAVDLVKIDELKDGYAFIQKVTEKYTKHTDEETYTDSQGKEHKREVERYSWDYYKTYSYKNKELKFHDMVFPAYRFDLSSFASRLSLTSVNVGDDYVRKVHNGYIYKDNFYRNHEDNLRSYYEVVKPNFTGTIFAELSNNTLKPVKDSKSIHVYNNDIERVVKRFESSSKIYVVMFWIIWVILIAGVIALFVAQRNRWADIDLDFKK